jgi:iron(III) transport system ATP-binding protein
LNDVSFSIDRGELICLLGPSGCGKTTLLRAIAGLDPQSSGTIGLGGRDVSRLPASKRNFGIVFQSYALFPNLSVFDNIGYGLAARGARRSEITRRVQELLSLIELSGAEQKFPAQLSGGQQQRVALARALATAPTLLLLDEPLSALDAQVRVYLREEIRSLQKRLGITTILVTHDQDEALAMADRIILLRQGVIEQVGSPRQIYERPASEFAMRFVGASNSLPAIKMGANRVRIAGYELNGADLFPGADGDEVTVCFRPEDVRFGNELDPNVLRAVVASLTFKGSHWRVVSRLGDDARLVVHADISAEVFRKNPICEGADVFLPVAPERIRVFARGK